MSIKSTSASRGQQPKYDVAISFLAKDESIAGAVNDALSQGLKVFFFPRSQEELAGTDGLESMRTPFLTDSRVNVILFREPWGATPWTRVEETAIKEACLNRGWSSLFFMALDKASKLPLWVPATLVRFNLSDYGVAQAVGAIKARVQDAGGKIEPPNAMVDARRVQQEAQFLGTLRALSASIDAKDRYTRGHSERVAHLAAQMAEALKFDTKIIEDYRVAGQVHDVGKIGVPELSTVGGLRFRSTSRCSFHVLLWR